MLSRDRAAQQLGITIEGVGAGFAQIAMTVNETMINSHATAHGGALFTFADTAFAFACNSRDIPHVALDASMSFTAPARLGDRLTAIAIERSKRGRTGVYDVTVTNGSGELVSVFRGTCYRIHGTVLGGSA